MEKVINVEVTSLNSIINFYLNYGIFDFTRVHYFLQMEVIMFWLGMMLVVRWQQWTSQCQMNGMTWLIWEVMSGVH